MTFFAPVEYSKALSNQVLFKTNNILLPVQWNGFNDLFKQGPLYNTVNFLCLSKPVIATHFASFTTLTCTCSGIEVTVYARIHSFILKLQNITDFNFKAKQY